MGENMAVHVITDNPRTSVSIARVLDVSDDPANPVIRAKVGQSDRPSIGEMIDVPKESLDKIKVGDDILVIDHGLSRTMVSIDTAPETGVAPEIKTPNAKKPAEKQDTLIKSKKDLREKIKEDGWSIPDAAEHCGVGEHIFYGPGEWAEKTKKKLRAGGYKIK